MIEHFAQGGLFDAEDLGDLFERIPPALAALADDWNEVSAAWMTLPRSTASHEGSYLEHVLRIATRLWACLERGLRNDRRFFDCIGEAAPVLSFVECCRLAISQTPAVDEEVAKAALEDEASALLDRFAHLAETWGFEKLLEDARERIKHPRLTNLSAPSGRVAQPMLSKEQEAGSHFTQVARVSGRVLTQEEETRAGSPKVLENDRPAITVPEGTDFDYVLALGSVVQLPSPEMGELLREMVARFPGGLSLDEVRKIHQSGWTRLAKMGAGNHWFAAAVCCPGGRGKGGYRIRSTREAEAIIANTVAPRLPFAQRLKSQGFERYSIATQSQH